MEQNKEKKEWILVYLVNSTLQVFLVNWKIRKDTLMIIKKLGSCTATAAFWNYEEEWIKNPKRMKNGLESPIRWLINNDKKSTSPSE